MKKIRLKPTMFQKKLLAKWNDAYRFSYNMALGIVKNDHEINEKIDSPYNWLETHIKKEKKASHSVFYSKYDLRNIIVPAGGNASRPWLLETPFQIRAYSVFEFHNRYKTCITNLRNKNIKHFDMKFKTKRNFRWTMDIPKDNIYLHDNNTCKNHEVKDYNGNTIETLVSQEKCYICKFLPRNQFKLYQESGWIKTTENLDQSILEKDSKIHFDGQNYYILIPYTKKELKVNNKSNWFCALDPGSRKFQTVYSPDENKIINIGTNASTKMHEHLLRLDSIISKQTKTNNKNIKFKK